MFLTLCVGGAVLRRHVDPGMHDTCRCNYVPCQDDRGASGGSIGAMATVDDVRRIAPAPDVLANASSEAFGDLANPYRPELLVHCYRMLGTIDDAEDAVQETYTRAWRSRETYRRNVSFRAWLYRIATNACLDAIERSRRSPAREPAISPFPDDETADDPAAGPEARYDAHESISLAFATVLQVLPPRQRAVLILRDVLSWQAAEVAELLDLSAGAVNSALHRARQTMSRNYHRQVVVPFPHIRELPTLGSLLERYVRAWEAADIPGLVALLRDDAVLAMPPGLSFAGQEAIATFLAEAIFRDGRQMRLVPIRANGERGFAAYARKTSAGPFDGFAVLVLSVDDTGIARIDAFRDLGLLARFGLPLEFAA